LNNNELFPYGGFFMNFNSKLALCALLIPTFASPMHWFNTPLKKVAGITAAAGITILAYQVAKSYGLDIPNWIHCKVHASCQENLTRVQTQKDKEIGKLTTERSDLAKQVEQLQKQAENFKDLQTEYAKEAKNNKDLLDKISQAFEQLNNNK
jgi:peptidoglycan hydrolase CwlO-like protein